MKAQTDIVIIGAGPAGLSAALWLQKFRTSFILLDRAARIGGELARINLPITDFLGTSYPSGLAFIDDLERSYAKKKIPLSLSTEVIQFDVESMNLTTNRGEFHAKVVIIASGLLRRRLKVPGEEAYLGRGVTYSATTDQAYIAGHPAAVLGGGDGALENALFLANICPKVLLIHRDETLRARPEFIERVKQTPNIQTFPRHQILELAGDGERLTALKVNSPDGENQLAVDWLVIKIGFVPNTPFLTTGAISQDGQGYIIVDRRLSTSRPAVFAAGDVCNPQSPSIAAAVGDGAVAAKSAYNHLKSLNKL